jgi:low temperature requirement protein LtrA
MAMATEHADSDHGSAQRGQRTGASVATDQSRQSDNGRSQGSMELIFNIVFSFAMSQVTQLMLANPSWVGYGRGVLALLAVWWAWVCYTWLTNTFDINRVPYLAVMVVAMAALLIAATALPRAFTDQALAFGAALLMVRGIHVVLMLFNSSGDEQLRRASLRMAPTFLAGPALLLAAAFVHSWVRELLWVMAACIDFTGPLLSGMRGFRVVPSYFVQRHTSIVIIAIAQAITGLGNAGKENLDRPGVVCALVLGVVLSATLWSTYFSLTPGAKKRLRELSDRDRVRVARDAYSYLHVLLVGGIVIFAVGARVSVQHFDKPLPFLLALALTGGVALFYSGDVAYRWREHHQLVPDRLLAAAASLAVLPIATTVPALAALAALTAVAVVRLGWELWRRPRIGPVRAGVIR